MNRPLRWGILGSGSIAGRFASQLPASQQGVLSAVGSRSASTAGTFASHYGGAACSSYESLLARDDVDAVYVSLPNSMHHPWTIAALKAGKHVLCEKPLAGSAEEAEAMFAAAAENQRVLVEAFMYRTDPAVQRFIQMARQGDVGAIQLIRTHFTFNRQPSAQDCRYQARLAGGSLMDVGCYCINLARAIAGCEPDAAYAAAHVHPLGVDDYAAGVLKFGDILCVFSCGMTVENDRTTYVGGKHGYLQFDTPWFSEGEFTLVQGPEQKSRQLIRMPRDRGLYAMEADAFADSVFDGKPPWITPQDSLGNIRVLEELRRQIGLKYVSENPL